MMPETASPTPLALDRVERSRAARDHVRLRVSGRWLGPDAMPRDGSEALLVVELHGRRHRFPAARDARRDGAPAAPGARFSVSFTIPDWAVPALPGQAQLWVGETVMPVPPPGTMPAPVTEPAGDRASETADPSFEALAAGVGRTGPLAELLSREAVAALRAELEQRTAEAVRLRGALAEARRDLERHKVVQAGLESAHAELREELAGLTGAVTEQREELQRGLAGARVELERAEAERDAAREQLERARDERETARTELAQAREELGQAREQLGQAREELGQAREQLGQAREELGGVRAQADQEMSRAREQSEQELALVRAQAEQELTEVRGDAEAQARELGERLTGLIAAERKSVQEAAGLRERLAAAHISREAALGEASGLRAELERIGAELVTLREAEEERGGDLGEARQLLADARALSQRLRAEGP